MITFGALTSSHKFYYDFYDSQNSLTFKHFLRTLFDKLSKKKQYLLVLDNAGFHKTCCVRNLLQEYPHICAEYLPPYSPELNPIETCWKVTKGRVTKSQYFENIDDMQEALESFWEGHIFMQDFMRYLCP